MKNKLLVVLLCLTLIALPLFSACVAQGEVIELSTANFWPASHFINTKIIPSWIDEVEEATNGRVNITNYPGQTLLKASETYDGVVSGIADIGCSCFAYTRGRFPLMEAFELPGIPYNNAQVVAATVRDCIEEFEPEELSDTKVLFIFGTGPGCIWSKEPIHNLDDLEGLIIRGTGLSGKAIEALGAVPSDMPQPDVYDALSKGIVDGNLSPPEVLRDWNQADVVDYITVTPPIYQTLFFYVMNLDKWNSLPSDIQDAFDEVNDGFWIEAASMYDDEQVGSIDYAVDEKGCQLITLSDEEKAAWLDKVTPIQDDFVAEMVELELPGQELLNRIKTLVSQYNEEYPSSCYIK